MVVRMADDIVIVRDAGWAQALGELLVGATADIPAWMRAHTELLKSDVTSEVGLLQLRDELCYLKFYRHKTAAHRRFFRRGRAVRSFDVTAQMSHRALPVPRPRACLRVPGGMLLLAEGIPSAQDLGAMWSTGGADTGTLMPAAGGLLAKLHREGFAHGDCKWPNLLWTPGKDFYLVDLDGARSVPSGHARQARDLARFTLDAEERELGSAGFELFLDNYLAGVEYSREQVLQDMLPALRKLRARHLARYGPRGSRLLVDT